MENLFGLFANEDENEREHLNESLESAEHVEDSATMNLREEELDVSKHSVQTGEVALHKDIVEETQTVDVPVTHEEVVVERRAVNAAPSDEPIGDEETIRIPVSEERVDVHKNTIVTGEVALHKRAVQETEHVSETVRKERAHVEVEGDPDVIEASAHDDVR
ncbi:MAG TPA: YsnF/AvaK domain-containing protein [Symbiobacteriaceae bacterium]|nr:YsnF/AvaK domain-containing protein [Symbiobacteriaceae bacterium]